MRLPKKRFCVLNEKKTWWKKVEKETCPSKKKEKLPFLVFGGLGKVGIKKPGRSFFGLGGRCWEGLSVKKTLHMCEVREDQKIC